MKNLRKGGIVPRLRRFFVVMTPWLQYFCFWDG